MPHIAVLDAALIFKDVQHVPKSICAEIQRNMLSLFGNKCLYSSPQGYNHFQTKIIFKFFNEIIIVSSKPVKTSTSTKTNKTLNVNQYPISFRIGNKATKITIHPTLVTVVADHIKAQKFVKDDHQAELAAKTAIARLAASHKLEQAILNTSANFKKSGTFSNFCANQLMIMFFDETLMSGYEDNQYGFIAHRCQLPTTVLTNDNCGDGKVDLHPAMNHALTNLAAKLEIKLSDILNYFVWLYTIKNTEPLTNELIKNGCDRTFKYRSIVIDTLRKDKFDLELIKKNYLIFKGIRDTYKMVMPQLVGCDSNNKNEGK
ncbi:hypothetical protein [Photobacterium leiognathi]|uniref:hypothetical protein n=1 Tax=Photobacterium leiognathi TaxID=553611 RepID=UPI002981E363|nr:hypothetical protein [Photobacterium leiognathi]